MNNLFLTAEWRKLSMVNYIVDPSLLKKYLPSKTELDFWNERCYVSLVAFMFADIKVKGCSIPFHRDFEEVNLRFYVRYKEGANWKRGVVFIREFVSLPMVTLVANSLYQEKYKTIPMSHNWLITPEKLTVDYRWRKPVWHSLKIEALNITSPIAEGSEQEFITQHFWGYAQRKGYTSEYQVEHELWKSYEIVQYNLEVDYTACYGEEFGFLNHQTPHTVFLAEGSAINIYKDRKI